MGGSHGTYGGKTSTYRRLVWKYEETETNRKTKREWEYNIKKNLK